MQKIPLSLANESMTLAKPVTKDNGMVLIAQGTKLTHKIIERLTKMGIKQIVVEGHPVDLGDTGASSSFTKRLTRLDHLFRRYNQDPWMQEVKVCIQEYYQTKALAEQALAEQEAPLQPSKQEEQGK